MPKKATKPKLLTSEDWQKKFKDKITVLDADGWDRQNFDFSWKEEKITEAEFKKRCGSSTLKFLDKNFLK